MPEFNPSKAAALVCVVCVLGHLTAARAQDGFYKRLPYPNELDPQLALIGPSRIQIGQPLDLQLVALGAEGEPTEMPATPVITCDGPCAPGSPSRGAPRQIAFAHAGGGIYHPVDRPSLSDEGYYLFTATDPQGEFLPFGLPVQATVESPRLQLHWGDLHGHSQLSDGACPAEEYYRWARDVARLDVMALTDHNWALNDQKIERLRELATEWHEPGRFVPFFAFEWAPGEARPEPAAGRPDHKHLIFRHNDEPLGPWVPDWSNTPSIAQLWSMLAGREVLVVPHHPGLPHATHFGTDWSQHSERFERLVEVFSDWGSSETPNDRYRLPEIGSGNSVREALAAGHHLGIVGGSDTHRSRPGLNALPHQGHPYPLTCLTAIEAPARTRDDLWIALYNRRCYAASGGRRPLLDVALDGAPMGARLAQPIGIGPRRLTATVAGSTPIREIIVVKNGQPAASFAGDGWCQRIEWVDAHPNAEREDSYYVRAEMADTSMCWSSPIWAAGPHDSDISAEARLWRLDGDALGRQFHVVHRKATDVTADQPLVLCEMTGAGAVDRLLIEAHVDSDESEVRSLVLRVWTDGASEPDIEACLDQLCFVAMGGKPFVTGPVAFSSSQREDGCWLAFMRKLRIPFAESCRIELSPAAGTTLPAVKSSVTYGQWKKGHAPRLGRMGRCVTRSLRGRAVEGTGTEVEILNIAGRGLLHSLQMAMRNAQTGGQYMEGNIEIYVDGESRSSYASSGTEEFFYGGIYFINPFWTSAGGCTLSIHEPGNTDRRTSAYRIFADDPITFDESLRIVWHNGQPGQGDVPGATLVDAQSVVYLQRDDSASAGDEPVAAAHVPQRLNLLAGDPELGPMVTDTRRVPRTPPGGRCALSEVEGAGHLRRIYLDLTGDPQRCGRAHLIIERDGEVVCDAPLAVLCGTGGSAQDFAAGWVGQTASVDGHVRLQRELLVPYRRSLRVHILPTADSGPVEGSAVVERRVAREGLTADFGPAQAPLLVYHKLEVGPDAGMLELTTPETARGGQVREVSIALAGLPSMRDVPVRVTVLCDGVQRAAWTASSLVSGCDAEVPAARLTPDGVHVRRAEGWSALVSLRDTPLDFRQSASLRIDASGLPAGVTVEAYLVVGRAEEGLTRSCADAELGQRLTALDGGVPAGRAICRTVLEDGDINPGDSATLLDIAGHGTLRCLRIGTPSSALPLRHSQLGIAPSLRAGSEFSASTDQVFATWFDPFPFWEGAGEVVRPSQLHRVTGGDHTSAYRLLNLPFQGRCRVTLSAPRDDAGVMAWLREHLPNMSPRQALRNGVELPEQIRDGLLRCADLGLYVQAYANRLDRNLDWGRWAAPRFVGVDGQELQPGQAITIAQVEGRGVLQGLQLAFENDQSAVCENCAIEIYVDGEAAPSWVAPSVAGLLLGTPVPGSGTGRQQWEQPATRGRDAVGAGNRLMSPEAGTTICTASAPYRLAGLRRFTRDAITFENSLRIACRHPAGGEQPTRVWALALVSTATSD